mgnify:CR=1 FL=1
MIATRRWRRPQGAGLRLGSVGAVVTATTSLVVTSIRAGSTPSASAAEGRAPGRTTDVTSVFQPTSHPPAGVRTWLLGDDLRTHF